MQADPLEGALGGFSDDDDDDVYGNFDIILDHFSRLFHHVPPHTCRVL